MNEPRRHEGHEEEDKGKYATVCVKTIVTIVTCVM